MPSWCSSRRAMISGILSDVWQKSYINKIPPGIGLPAHRGGPIFVPTNKPNSTNSMKLLKTLVVASMLVSTSALAQDRSPEEVYSMMVYNFTKYVQWPDHAGGGEFVIGVIGNSEIYKTLNEWYGGKPKGSKVTLATFTCPRSERWSLLCPNCSRPSSLTCP